MDELELKERLSRLSLSLEQLHRTHLDELAVNFRRLRSGINAARLSGSWKKSNRNLFSILGCTYDEQVHSNILAWLFDPEDSHGLGTTFLQKFLDELYPHELPQLDLSGPVIVQREVQKDGDRPDLIVKGTGWSLILENKIRSYEGASQTVRYASKWKSLRRPNERLFFVYLTPTGSQPLSDDFVPASYKSIRSILSRITFDPSLCDFIETLKDHIFVDLEDDYGQ